MIDEENLDIHWTALEGQRSVENRIRPSKSGRNSAVPDRLETPSAQ